MIPEVIKAAVAAALPGVEVTIRERAQETHQSNQLFELWAEGRHFIVKHFLKEDEWATSPAAEHASLQLLEPLDLAPRPFFYEAAVGPVVIYEYMEGRMWGRYQPSVAELNDLAAAMARVHSLPTNGLWLARGSETGAAERMVWFHKMLENYALWSQETFPVGQRVAALCHLLIERTGVVMEQLEQSMPARRFCRSDPRFANVIVRPDRRLGFVDWEDAGLRDPALEIGDLFLHPEQEDLLTVADYYSFLATYCKCMEIDEENLSRRVEEYGLVLLPFYIVILMRYGIALSRTGRLKNWLVNEMPANQRLRRYLARAMARSMWEFDAGEYEDVLFFPTM